MRWKYPVATALLAVCLPTVVSAQDDSAATESAVAVGSPAPDFELTSLGEDTFTLSSLQGEDGKYAAVVFVRAYW